jgi:hypothetical protein
MVNDDCGLDGQEFFHVAERLVKTLKMSAAAYVERKIEVMEENGDEETQTYWENVLKQVERILYEV